MVSSDIPYLSGSDGSYWWGKNHTSVSFKHNNGNIYHNNIILCYKLVVWVFTCNFIFIAADILTKRFYAFFMGAVARKVCICFYTFDFILPLQILYLIFKTKQQANILIFYVFVSWDQYADSSFCFFPFSCGNICALHIVMDKSQKICI